MIDELLGELGYRFRSLTLHSDGRWSAHIGKAYAKEKGFTQFMVTGKTPIEALLKLKDKIGA